LATRGAGPFEPPTATPLASPPAEPAGDGTTVTIETTLGNIVMEIYNESAPVAATNFTDLVDAGYYNTLVFHRIMPGFVIQGGDPNGDGTGGPGYTIPDEPVVGDYERGTLAMARTSAPNSQGSQFFIVLDDAASASLDGGNYVIFGKVTSGMEIADQIAAGPSTGGQESTALDPVAMERVTVQRP
jgi:cyclophilin family peptidyl-prolyl cis-trans isomerase